MGEVQLGRYLDCRRRLAALLPAGESVASVAPDFLATVGGLTGWEAGALWQATEGSAELGLAATWSAPSGGEAPWPEGLRAPFQPRLPGSETTVLTAEVGLPGDVLAVVAFVVPEPSAEAEAILVSFADQLAAFAIARRAEEQRRIAEEMTSADRAEAERVRQHMAEVVRGTQDAVISKDLDGLVTSWNPAAERLYGYTAEEVIGRHISFLVPADHHGEETRILERVRGGERLETYETERIRADGTRIDVSLTISQIRNPAKGVVGASVVARDITRQKRRQRAQEFLVGASRLLDLSLDPAETARTIVTTAVPELAELCVIDFVREDGWLGDSIVAGRDPEMAARLEAIRRAAPLDPAGQHPVAQVLREERPMVWRELKSPGVVEDIAQNDDHKQLMEDAGYNSAAVVPLRARGRTLGGLSFLHARPDLRYDAEDLEFLAELGDRAAMALDNARLYQERDRMAQNLQRGLRPPGPKAVPGLEISVVFEAAGDGVLVGGDFYDVLPTEDGCWILIGDVAGKGSAAAGVSVAARHSVRGLTRVIAEPEHVLAGVNDLLLTGSTLNDFATAQLLRLRRGPDGWHLTLAAAGHPPAVHVSDSEAAQLGGGTLLGAKPEAEVQRHEATLSAGDTIVLCTDGWLEAGPAEAHHEPEALASIAASLAAVELDEVTARLRADAIGRGDGALRDDMVILAVRPSGTGTADEQASRELAAS